MHHFLFLMYLNLFVNLFCGFGYGYAIGVLWVLLLVERIWLHKQQHHPLPSSLVAASLPRVSWEERYKDNCRSFPTIEQNNWLCWSSSYIKHIVFTQLLASVHKLLLFNFDILLHLPLLKGLCLYSETKYLSKIKYECKALRYNCFILSVHWELSEQLKPYIPLVTLNASNRLN